MSLTQNGDSPRASRSQTRRQNGKNDENFAIGANYIIMTDLR
jgi:hypothetical protein